MFDVQDRMLEDVGWTLGRVGLAATSPCVCPRCAAEQHLLQSREVSLLI